MLKVGVTGGIGSGKTIVTRFFELLQVPVLRADDVAKMLMQSDPDLKQALQQTFGHHIYSASGKLLSDALAAAVFGNPAALEKLNALVHPVVIHYGKKWMEDHAGYPYAIKEAALFFESGSYVEMDVMVGVYAPRALRIQRALKRDQRGLADIEKRMAAQWDEAEKMRHCQYIIYNDDTQLVIPQMLDLHRKLMQAR